MGYTSKAVQGFSWHSFFKFSTTGLVAIKLIILARILSPTDFGLFSLVAIALGITESVTPTGINLIIMQSKKSVEYFLNTAWVIAIIRGLIIAIIMNILALVMSRYYQRVELLPLISLASFVPFIKGFINPAIIKMQKEMSFLADSFYRISLVLVEVTVSILLGLIFRSVYVFVIGMITSSIFEVAISFIFFKERPLFIFSKNRALEIFESSKWLNISAFFSYLHENLDNLLIGKLTTITSLGFYQNAYALSHKPNFDLSQSVSHSVLPVYAQISSTPTRLKRAFFKSTLFSMTTFLLLSLPLLIYPQITVLILGNNWYNSVPLVRPLVLAGLIQAFANLCYNLFYIQKKYKIVNYHLGLSTLLMVVMILLLTPKYELVGAAWAVFISRALPLLILLSFFIKDHARNKGHV